MRAAALPARRRQSGKSLAARFCVAQSGSDRCNAEAAMSLSRHYFLVELIAPHRLEQLFRLLIDAAQEANPVHFLPHSWERAP
jgi:hypothetical protein